MIKKVAVVLLCCASWSWAKECWTKTPEGIRQEVACDESAMYRSSETAPHHPQPAWATGEVTALMPPAQTWDAKTGGTEVADKIKWDKAHPYTPQAVASVPESSDTGKGGK